MGLGPIMSWVIMLMMILSILGHCADTAMRMAGMGVDPDHVDYACAEYGDCQPEPPPDPY